MNKLRMGIIGCGRISYKHIEALINNAQQIELTALCDLTQDKMVARKNQYLEAFPKANVTLFKDYKNLLASGLVDAVAIATESGYHAEHALASLEAGCHVIVEKPMAMSLEDAQKMNDLADERGLKLCVSHQNRFNPTIQKLRRAVEEGRFGRILSGTARILWTRDENYYKQAPWRGTKALDGGTLMNQCIHNIDLLQWMMNSDVKRVQAERETFLRPIEMEDFGALLIRFESGSIGIVEGSACVYPKNLEETLSIFGEKGTVVIGGLAVNEIKTWQFEDEEEEDYILIETEVDSVYGKGHTPLYLDFYEAIRDDRKPYVAGTDGIKALNIILTAYGLDV